MTIAYIHDWPLERRAANMVQVVHFCEALNSFEDVRLYIPVNQRAGVDPALFDVLGRNPSFQVEPFVRPPWLPGRKRVLAAYALLHGKLHAARLWYTRSPQLGATLAQAGRKVAIELHVPPQLESSRSHRCFRRLLDSGYLAAVVCITQALAKEIRATYELEDDVIIVAPDGAEASPAPPASDQADPVCRIVYAGSFYPGKGLELVVQLAREAPDLEFVVLGGSPSDASWAMGSEPVPSNLSVLGRLPHHKVRPALRGARVALAPMQSRVLGIGGDVNLAPYASPLKLFEYFAAGVPVVASDLPGHREVLEHGSTGLLCPPKDVRAWLGAIRSFVDNPRYADDLAHRAHQQFYNRWSWDARAHRVHRVLRRS